MKRCATLFLTTLLIVDLACAQITDLSASAVSNGLKVSGNKHYLVDASTGKPVFLLATTLWNINSLTYPEIDTLLQSVAANGFNAIMFALDFYPQADEQNIYGEKAYIGPDKTDLNPAYFTYCDRIVEQCTRYGIYPMIYTMWSGKNSGIMNTYTADKLYTLGKKIGAKYKHSKNVILVVGGESSPPYIDSVLGNAMGRGLKEGCGGNNLITVHPCSPHSNSEYYAKADWLDLYMSQGKSNMGGLTFDLTKAVTKDYALIPEKPTMVAEHRYESGTLEDPVIQRRSLYLSVFAGGFGYAYGHNALWQMTPHTAQKWMLNSWKSGVTDWKQALNTTAQQQLQYIKTLLYAFPYLSRVPDQSLLLTAQADGVRNKVEVMRDGETGKKNATYIMAYVSSAQPLSIKTDVICSEKLNAYWFDPCTGAIELVAKGFDNQGTYHSDAKTGGSDLVLVIADAAKNYLVN